MELNIEEVFKRLSLLEQRVGDLEKELAEFRKPVDFGMLRDEAFEPDIADFILDPAAAETTVAEPAEGVEAVEVPITVAEPVEAPFDAVPEPTITEVAVAELVEAPFDAVPEPTVPEPVEGAEVPLDVAPANPETTVVGDGGVDINKNVDREDSALSSDAKTEAPFDAVPELAEGVEGAEVPLNVAPATPDDSYTDEEDIPEDLFGNFGQEEEPKAEKKKRGRSINETVHAKTSVMDVMAEKAAWRKDIPGPAVKDIRSAIGLNDRVQFIGSLFRKDSQLYQNTIASINEMEKLDEVVAYLAENFPEWKMESDNVYRFMMAIRRKIR